MAFRLEFAANPLAATLQVRLSQPNRNLSPRAVLPRKILFSLSEHLTLTRISLWLPGGYLTTP